MKRYVVGFLFDKSLEQVVLVHKKRPDWQRGKFNGPGGRIEEGECALTTMVREFHEECGVECLAWSQFLSMSDDPGNKATWEVVFFYAVDYLGQYIPKLETKTDEPVYIKSVRELKKLPTVPNLEWLVQMAIMMAENYSPNDKGYVMHDYIRS